MEVGNTRTLGGGDLPEDLPIFYTDTIKITEGMAEEGKIGREKAFSVSQ